MCLSCQTSLFPPLPRVRLRTYSSIPALALIAAAASWRKPIGPALQGIDAAPSSRGGERADCRLLLPRVVRLRSGLAGVRRVVAPRHVGALKLYQLASSINSLPSTVVGSRLMASSAELNVPDAFENKPKIRQWRKAHGSIRVQEWQPNLSFCCAGTISCRPSGDHGSGFCQLVGPHEVVRLSGYWKPSSDASGSMAGGAPRSRAAS